MNHKNQNSLNFIRCGRLNKLKHTLKIMLSLCLIASCMFLTGCEGRELDTLAIVTSIEISAAEGGQDANKCKMQAEIIKTENSESEGMPSNCISVAEGKNMLDCLKKLEENESRQFYLGHLRVLIFDDDYLKTQNGDEMKELADFAVENDEIRFNTLILAADSSNGTVLEAETNATGNRGMDLSDELRLGGSKNIESVEIVDIINQMYFGERNISLPVITIKQMNDKMIAVIDQDRRCETAI